MAFSANAGSPVAFGTGQSGSDDRSLFLKMFGGEVLTSFTATTSTAGKVTEKTITSGKSHQFPKTGVSKAEYMSRGQEAMGNPFETAEVEITVDGVLSASHSIWDLDAALSHFDVRGPMAEDMGQALARVYDQNNFRQIALAARQAAVSVFPGGTRMVNAGLVNTGVIDGKVWIDQIRLAKIALRKKNVLATNFYMAVDPAVFDAIKYATNSQGVYLNMSNDVRGAGTGLTVATVSDTIVVEGVQIYSTNLLPNSDESANGAVWPKYRANYSKTTGLMWTADAVGVLKLKGVAVETFRDVRRQENFLIATSVVGHGTLRPECAVEFASA